MRELADQGFDSDEDAEIHRTVMEMMEEIADLPKIITPKELYLQENDLSKLARELSKYPSLIPMRDEAFGPVLTESAVKDWVAKHAGKFDYGKWAAKAHLALYREFCKDRGLDANEPTTLSALHPQEEKDESFFKALPFFLQKNTKVPVDRGINRRIYDYFSNHVVAELKHLHLHRQPSFSINAYAPDVVSLMLAKTMSFGQPKEYFLFLIHHDLQQDADMSYRMIGLQHDCSSLGIRVLAVDSTKRAAAIIEEAELKAQNAAIRGPIPPIAPMA
jgi:hypothetical protein